MAISQSFTCTECKIFESLTCTVPAEQGKCLPFYFNSHTVNKYPFQVLFSLIFTFLCFFVGDLAAENAPHTHSAGVLSSAPKSKKAVMHLTEKIRLCANYGTAGHEFNVNKSAMYIFNKVSLNRSTHKTCIDLLCVTRGSQESNSLFLLGATVPVFNSVFPRCYRIKLSHIMRTNY